MKYPTPLVLSFVALFATSCFFKGEPESSSEIVPPEPLYDCARDGFPCTFEDVDQSVHDRGVELMDAARERLADGEEMAQVAEWLRGQDDVASADANEVSLIFRLEDGRPLALHDGVAAANPMPTAGQQLQPSGLEVRRGAVGQSDVDEFVVGADRDEDGQRDFHKRALILEPFEWQLADGYTVRGDDILAALEPTPDYRADNIDYVENDDVGILEFRNWDEYDFIHIGTHGGVITGERDGKHHAASFILSGIELENCGVLGDRGELIREHGIMCASLNVGGWEEHREYLAVLPRFFERNYDGGLDDTLVILDGCRSGRPVGTAGRTHVPSTLLASRLIGRRSAVFGWTHDVEVHFAEKAMQALAGYLIEDGLPASEALERVCADDWCLNEDRGAELVLYTNADTDVRAVEALELFVMEEEPPRRVESGLDLPALILGNVGDGQPDSIAALPQLQGVSDPGTWKYTMTPVIDGEEQDGSPIELGGPAGAKEVAPFTYRAQIPAFVLLEDDIQAGETMSVQFRVALPHRSRSNSPPGYSISPKLEHTFGACSVELELSGHHSGVLSGTSAEYDIPTETIHLMALDDAGEPAFVTAELSDGDLTEARMTYSQDVLSWTPNSPHPASIDLTQQSGSVEGTLSVTFPVTDNSTTGLTATFDAIVDEDGSATGCVY